MAWETSFTIRVAGILALLLLTGCSADKPTTETSAETSAEITAETTAEITTLPATTSPTTDASTSTTTATSTTAAVEPLQGNYTVEVIAALPHDALAYTQGLEWHEGSLYESTGQYGSSDRRRLDPTTGEVDLLVPLDDAVFGEGLTIIENELLQLSWREGELQRSGLDDLETRTTQYYEGEGWGLCHDGDTLIMSDGSSTLTRRDQTTFEAISTLDVTANGEPVARLNELECIGGQVYANVYGLDQIVVIDTTSGIVVAVIDASVLRPDGLPADDNDYVLNGIAYQPESGHWFLTGKYWPVLYEVEFIAN